MFNTPSSAEVKEILELCPYSPLSLHNLLHYLYLYQQKYCVK
jgi:hypothetical protein